MVDDYILDKVLDKIKEIVGFEKFEDIKILIEADDKLLDDITLENVVILITWIIKMIINFILNYFLKKHCLMNAHGHNM